MNLIPKGSKTTLRENLTQVWKSTGKKPKQLEELPELPEETAYLWQWFCEVYGGDILSFSEIDSWSRVTKKNLRVFEVEELRALSVLNNQVVVNDRNRTSNSQSQRTGDKPNPPRAGQGRRVRK